MSAKPAFRYSPKHDAENEFIADLLEGLTKAHRTWGFGLCLPHTCAMSRAVAMSRYWFEAMADAVEP